VLYAPVLAAAGVGHSFDLLIRYPVQDLARYESLPFPVGYDGVASTSPILLFYLPLVLMIGLAGSLAALAARFARERWWQVAVAIFAIGMAHYLVTRPDAFHTAPLAVMVAVLASWAIATRDEPSRVGWLSAAGVVAATVAVGYAIVEGLDRRRVELRADRVELRLPAADGVRVASSERAALDRTVGYVRRHTQPGEPIYVAPKRSDLVTSAAPLVYVLADRPNATRYDIAAPGIITSEQVQDEIVSDLQDNGVRVVVRWTDPASATPEPNRAGRSSGVTILDAYIAAAFKSVARYGDYEVLERP
jgi:hypothetical protein